MLPAGRCIGEISRPIYPGPACDITVIAGVGRLVMKTESRRGRIRFAVSHLGISFSHISTTFCDAVAFSVPRYPRPH
jgi:hypothetical protein